MRFTYIFRSEIMNGPSGDEIGWVFGAIGRQMTSWHTWHGYSFERVSLKSTNLCLTDRWCKRKRKRRSMCAKFQIEISQMVNKWIGVKFITNGREKLLDGTVMCFARKCSSRAWVLEKILEVHYPCGQQRMCTIIKLINYVMILIIMSEIQWNNINLMPLFLNYKERKKNPSA